MLNPNNQIDSESNRSRSSSRSNLRRSGTQVKNKSKGNMSNHDAGSKKEYHPYRRSSTSKSNKKKKSSEENSDHPSALNRKQTGDSNNRRISFIRG